MVDIRKEQALFLGTLAILGLLYVNSDGKKLSKRSPTGRILELPEIGETAEVLLDGGGVKVAGLKRDLFVEPSDISVLPPLEPPELDLPALPDFPVVLPILELGVDNAHWYLQRLPVATIRALGQGTQTASSTAGNTTGNTTGNTAGTSQDPGTEQEETTEIKDIDPQAEKEKAWAKQYDMVLIGGSKHWCKVLNKDPYRLGRPVPEPSLHLLEVQGPFAPNAVIRYRKMNPERGTVSIPELKVAGPDLAKISFIRFADTISNTIAMKRVRLPVGEIGLPEREAFILELLTKYRDYPEAFRAAEEQALRYIEINPISPRGHELLCLVYSISGQLEKELAKYKQLMQGRFHLESFVYRGLGTLEARLGMDEAAEEHLRRAVRLNESDAKARFALARFYRSKSRGPEALVEAEGAVKNLGPKLRKEESFAISSLYVACLLGEGKVEQAKTALLEAGNHLTSRPEDSAAYNLLSAAVRYQEGKFDEAARAFADAAQGMGDPVLPATGQAMAQFRLGRISDAVSAAESGLNRDPLQRYRVLTVKGFLRASQNKIDEAVETIRTAQVMAPRSPYTLYILGHWLSHEGRFDEAQDVLENVLSKHSEIVEVMAEYALILVRKAKAAGLSAEAHGLLTRAERYAKKVCEIEEDRAKLWIYQDLLGVIRYYLRNNEGARAAFKKAIDWAPLADQTHPKIFLTLLDYRDGRIDDTLAELNNIREQVKADNPLHAKIGELRKAILTQANKRLYKTDFELPGKIEKDFTESKTKPRWNKRGGDITVDGKSEGQPVFMRMTIPQGTGKLVEVSVDLEVGKDFQGNHAFFRITDLPIKQATRQSRSSYEFKIGYERGLHVYMHEGGPTKKPLIDKREARRDFSDPGLSWKKGERHRLGFRVERSDQGSKKATLIVLIDGREVARSNVSVMSATRGRPVHLDLWVAGDKAAHLQATFDNFVMIRQE